MNNYCDKKRMVMLDGIAVECVIEGDVRMDLYNYVKVKRANVSLRWEPNEKFIKEAMEMPNMIHLYNTIAKEIKELDFEPEDILNELE